jgi:hypothetical protein
MIVFDSLWKREGDVRQLLFPSLQFKRLLEICGNRKSFRAADCFLRPLNVIPGLWESPNTRLIAVRKSPETLGAGEITKPTCLLAHRQYGSNSELTATGNALIENRVGTSVPANALL